MNLLIALGKSGEVARLEASLAGRLRYFVHETDTDVRRISHVANLSFLNCGLIVLCKHAEDTTYPVIDRRFFVCYGVLSIRLVRRTQRTPQPRTISMFYFYLYYTLLY